MYRTHERSELNFFSRNRTIGWGERREKKRWSKEEKEEEWKRGELVTLWGN